MPETDAEFIDSMEKWVIGSLVFKKEHRDCLFALVRRGAEADAAIAIVRKETLEEAARVAKVMLENYDTMDNIPAAIRALGEKHLTPQEREAMHSALRASVKKVTP